MKNLNPQREIQPVNEGQNGQIIYNQLGNNSIIHIVNDRDRDIRDYALQ